MSAEPVAPPDGGCPKCQSEWRVALAYLRTKPGLEQSRWTRNQCQVVVGDLVEVRPGSDEAAMVGARPVWLVGHRHPVPCNPHMRDGQEEAEHRVVVTAGGCLIDLTRRQYDPDADVPTHYGSLDDAGRHWRAATRADAADEQLQPLLDPDSSDG